MNIVEELKHEIAELEARLERIQTDCSHPDEALDRSAHSNTGNYDPSADAYWYQFHCRLCDKSWREPQ